MGPACICIWHGSHARVVKLNTTRWRGILKGGPQLADRTETADHIHKDATDRYALCLRALLLFARPIVNIGDYYYCVVLTIINVIPNGVTCIYKILEIN